MATVDCLIDPYWQITVSWTLPERTKHHAPLGLKCGGRDHQFALL